MQLQIGYDRKTQGDKKSMGLDTQTMLKAENGCVDLVDNPSSGRDKLQEIARLQPGWLTKICGEMSGLGEDMISYREDSFASESIHRIGKKKTRKQKRGGCRLRLARMISSSASASRKHSSLS